MKFGSSEADRSMSSRPSLLTSATAIEVTDDVRMVCGLNVSYGSNRPLFAAAAHCASPRSAPTRARIFNDFMGAPSLTIVLGCGVHRQMVIIHLTSKGHW
jgi:hypothetical protein